MAMLDLTKSYIYRWRYYIGYCAVAIALILVLIFAGLYVPGGISQAEINSVVIGSHASITNPDITTVVNLPYYLLQRLSIHIFGVHDFSIKLPSLLLGFFSALGAVLLLRRWFAQNIAILASIVAITTGQFLFIAQSGNPSITYLLWSVWILYLATLIANRRAPRTLIKVLFFIVAALSLYTPLSIYPLIALGTAILLHPHLRFIIRQLSKPKLILGAFIALLILIPLIRVVINSPSLLLTLLGIPTTMPDIGANLAQLCQQFFGFATPGGTTLMTPVFGLGSALLIGIGLYHTIRTRVTAKSYVIFIWTILLIPIIILKPSFTTVTFLPLLLLLATGLLALMNYWYKLFPLNPYARIGGLIPIVILVVSLIASGLDRYVYGYHYDPDVATSFSRDLKLLPKNTSLLVVAPSEEAFYNIVAIHNKDIHVSLIPSGSEFTATHQAAVLGFSGYSVEHIVASTATTDADRFYVYKN